MTTAEQVDDAGREQVEDAGHVDVLDRRRRGLRHRRRAPPAGALPRANVRRPRRAGRPRRHVVDPPLSRACAPTATCSPTATGTSRGAARRSRRARRSSTTSTRSSRRTTWTQHIRYHHRVTAAAGRARTGAGPWRSPAPTPASSCAFTTDFLWMCQGYYNHDEALPAALGGHGPVRGPDRAPAAVAARTSTTPASASSSSARARPPRR